jgi:hypothetical protein
MAIENLGSQPLRPAGYIIIDDDRPLDFGRQNIRRGGHAVGQSLVPWAIREGRQTSSSATLFFRRSLAMRIQRHHSLVKMPCCKRM